MTLTILALALVVLVATLSLGCAALLVWTVTKSHMATTLRVTASATETVGTAIAQSGQTAAMAFAEANQAGMLALSKATELIEHSGIRTAEAIESSSRRAQEAVDQAGRRSQEVMEGAQQTIRLMSSQLFPSASPAPPTASPPEQDQVQAEPPWDKAIFGAEVRENMQDVQWPPGTRRDGDWILAPDTQQPGWDPAPAPPPMQPSPDGPDEVTMARFQYEQAKQVDPNPDG